MEKRWEKRHEDQSKIPKQWFFCKFCDYRALQKHQVPLREKTDYTVERDVNFPH